MNPGLDFWSFRHDLKIPNSPKSSSCGVVPIDKNLKIHRFHENTEREYFTGFVEGDMNDFMQYLARCFIIYLLDVSV